MDTPKEPARGEEERPGPRVPAIRRGCPRYFFFFVAAFFFAGAFFFLAGIPFPSDGG
jgi:hypothetical protein